MQLRPIIVGESNPYGGDDDYALYPAPDGCSGHRLCCLILGMSRKAYMDSFERMNLVQGKWSIRSARDRACEVGGCRLILLGSKVSAAFGYEFTPFSVNTSNLSSRIVAILPHPSGLCRLWNELGAFAKARATVAAIAPEIAPFLGVK